MQRLCDVCGTPFEARRAISKYCSGACRARASRLRVKAGKKPTEPAPKVAELVPEPPPPGPVEAAVRTQLQAAEREGSPLGAAALALAQRVDRGFETGSGLASVVKQLEATLKAATIDVKSPDSALDRARDELAQRRAQHGA